MTSPDVLIIGGGLVGCALACELVGLGASVTLLERGRIGAATSGVNQGGIRQQFQMPVKVRAAQRTVELLRTFPERFEIDPAFRQNGYLFALGTPESEAQFRRAVAMQRSLGVPTEILSPEEIGRLTPGLFIEDLRGGAFCATDGYADPAAMVAGFAAGARRAGAVIRDGEAVRSCALTGERVSSVKTVNATYRAEIVINACGPWALQTAALYGGSLPLQARRSSIFLLGRSAEPFDAMPLTIDVDRRVTVCPRRDGIMVGSARKPVVAKPPPIALCDWSQADETIRRAAHRLPALADRPAFDGWAGYWEVTPDDNPIIGWTGPANVYTAAGFSGHGMSVIPGFACAIAQDVVGLATDLPLEDFRLDRFARPLAGGGEIWGGTTIADAEMRQSPPL
jgi:sarcosine oxidase subunit beta